MDTRILDVSVSHGCELFAQICAVLVFDVFDNGIPAVSVYSQLRKFLIMRGNWHIPSLIVKLVSVTRSVNDVESKSNTIFDDDYNNGQQ